MALTPGTRLGAHEILAPIGAGGMGEVYRARDTRLGRDVAIKVSSEQFTERFAIEARAIASLNHLNICTLYDVGANYLVMELVEGETLKGPLPFDTAIGYARQIAEGLEAAHEKGIVHRDLKPANIKVTPDGIVKLLDFGLAKTGSVTASSSDNSPTAIATATEAGIIMGTAAYMSPEQVKGRSVDKRSDIWAFGVVLYEMLTGRRLYEGETTQEILASILKEEPDLSRVPAQVQPLIRRCLMKDPKRRLRDIGDTMVLLEEIQGAAVPPSKASRLWPAVAVLALSLVAVLSGWILRRPTVSMPGITRFQIAPPPGHEFNVYLELSPDGRKLAFTAQGQDGRLRLWLRTGSSFSFPLPTRIP